MRTAALLSTLTDLLPLATHRLLLLVTRRLLLLATLGARGASLVDSGSVSLLRCWSTEGGILQRVGLMWKLVGCDKKMTMTDRQSDAIYNSLILCRAQHRNFKSSKPSFCHLRVLRQKQIRGVVDNTGYNRKTSDPDLLSIFVVRYDVLGPCLCPRRLKQFLRSSFLRQPRPWLILSSFEIHPASILGDAQPLFGVPG